MQTKSLIQSDHYIQLIVLARKPLLAERLDAVQKCIIRFSILWFHAELVIEPLTDVV